MECVQRGSPRNMLANGLQKNYLHIVTIYIVPLSILIYSMLHISHFTLIHSDLQYVQ